MNNDEYKNEKEVTFQDVFATVVGTIAFVSFIVALFSTIWGRWYLLKLSLTAIVLCIIATCLYWWIDKKLDELK